MTFSIKTRFSEDTYNLTESQVVFLIEKAKMFDEDNKAKAAPKQEPVRETRNERIFGNRSTWNTPKTAPVKAANQEGYKGFLHIRCEKCGREKTFCAKNPAKFHMCECGHRNWLTNLYRAVVECTCGGRFVYNTNIRDRQFTMSCFGCNKPVRLVLDCDGISYKTIK